MNADYFVRYALSSNNGVGKVYDGFGRGWVVRRVRPSRAIQINKKAENASRWFSAWGQGGGNGRWPLPDKNVERSCGFSCGVPENKKTALLGGFCVDLLDLQFVSYPTGIAFLSRTTRRRLIRLIIRTILLIIIIFRRIRAQWF
jgi:hypothetical protein